MPHTYYKQFFAVLALTLVMPLHSWAQQIRIIDCSGQLAINSTLAGCHEYDPDLLPFAQSLAGRALAFASRLPSGLKIDIQFDYSNDFSHQSRPGQPDLITVGEGMMIDMWNSYVDVWNMYEEEVDSDDPYADYESLVEWALYHEIGHALVSHSDYEHDDKDHETLADDFATVTMIRLYWQQDEDYLTRAELAAEGLYYLALPAGERAEKQTSGKRSVVARNASPKRKINKRRGVNGDDAHAPNALRSWDIACLVYGSRDQAPHPQEYQSNPDPDEECSKSDYAEVLEELATYYAPGLAYDN